MGKRNTGTIQPGEVRNPKGRPKGPMPRTVFRNAVMSLVTEQDHIKALQILRDAMGSDDIIIRLEAAKLWFSYFPPNQLSAPTRIEFKTQQEVMEYSAEYVFCILNAVTLDPDKLMIVINFVNGYIYGQWQKCFKISATIPPPTLALAHCAPSYFDFWYKLRRLIDNKIKNLS